MDYQQFSVSEYHKRPLLEWIQSALLQSGCRILKLSEPSSAPFRVTFEAPDGERMGIIAYAFLANRKNTRNRPDDEHRFQVKYGPNTDAMHELWQDPYGLYTTLFFGINPTEDFFVGADPVVHSPTRFYISIEFKDEHVDQIKDSGWCSWERHRRTAGGLEDPVEVMVGGRKRNFLQYVRFERAAKNLDAGHRALLADKVSELTQFRQQMSGGQIDVDNQPFHLHQLASEFELSQTEILDLIQSAPRLKMAVRGWVAEKHLFEELKALPEIKTCKPIEEDGKPDIMVELRNGGPIYIECKNILRKPYADGSYRLDFQRTRAAKGDPCSRYYSPNEFQILAACLHPQTERWEFSYIATRNLLEHDRCPGRLSNRVKIDDRWDQDVIRVLKAV